MNRNRQENRPAPDGNPGQPEKVPSQREQEAERERHARPEQDNEAAREKPESGVERELPRRD